ncbi:MAG TPA: FG-GAP-like repeat-containing protein [Terriglobia bacterium]|nr:FG-GAP-like repeat-containing protein [Terriglobia bacterium]
MLPTVLSLAISTASAQSSPVYVFGRADFTTGNSPAALVTGDFNGDGKPDLAVANQADNTISILLGQPDGTFGPKTDYAVGESPSALAVADFNLDGKLDLAVTNSTDGTVSVLLGNGDGTFHPQAVYAVGKSPSSVTAGAFNNASKNLDLAVANNADNTVSILIGNGDGTFAAQVTYAAGTAPASLITGDFRNDGKLDLVVGGSGASILLGNGDGTFGIAGAISSGSGPESVAVGDINQDGRVDVLVADAASSTVLTLLSNGDGTFSGADAPFQTGSSPTGVALADLGSAGAPYIVTANSGGSVSVLGSAGQNYLLRTDYGVSGSLLSLAAGDFNGDGHIDIAVANSTRNVVSAFIGVGNGLLQIRTDTNIGDPRPNGLITGDFDGDGKADLIVLATYIANCPATYLSNGDGTFRSVTAYPGTIDGGITGDFNNDGKLDLLVTGTLTTCELGGSTGGPAILPGNGDGTFGAAVTSPYGLVGDFNGDGKLDIAYAGGGGTLLVLGNGDFTFGDALTISSTLGPVLIGDFNGDGKLDLILESSAGTCYTALGNGDGTFGSPIMLNATGVPTVIGDFNGDGRLDLAVFSTGAVTILLGNGDGTFQPGISTAVSGSLVGVDDFNRDGISDLSMISSGAFEVLYGNGDGTFRPDTVGSFSASFGVGASGAGDMNGDGIQDLAVVDGSVPNQTLSVLIGQTIIGLYPSVLTFPDTAVGSTTNLNFTISNPASGSLLMSSMAASSSFTETNNCPTTLVTGANCAVAVSFAPTSAGMVSGSLTLTDSSPTSPQSIALTGTGGTELSISPASLIFALQAIGTVSTAQVVTLTNTSNLSLDFTAGATITGPNSADFQFCASMNSPGALCYYESVVADCGVTPSLAPGGSCTVAIAFDPTGGGTRSASLSFSDDAGGSPQSIPLSGTAPAPIVSLSASSLSFGDEPVGSASQATQVTLTNSGNQTLNLVGVTTSGDFVAANLCQNSIAVGASCVVSVVFKPSAGGARDGALSITDNATNSPQTVALSGTGTTPAVTLSPSSLNFGPTLAGQSAVATPVLLTNIGAAPLAISSIALTGSGASDFSQQNNCGSSVAAGATCTIDVTFKPAAGGKLSANLAVTDNAAGSPQLVAVAGTGNDFSLAPALGSSSSATVSAGQSATYKISVDATGNLTGTISLACSGAPMAAACTVNPSSMPVGLGVPSSLIVVTVTTTARSQALPHWPKWRPIGQQPMTRVFWLLAFVLLTGLAGWRAWHAAQPAARVSLLLGRSPALAIVPALILTLALIMSACGGSTPVMTGPTGTPAGTYMLTLMGTYTAGSASVQNSITLALVVQ